MRGFVLRFNFAAVPTSVDPAQPDDIGRSRYKPRPDGDPPYYTQDLGEAEAQELKHCHSVCGIPCYNRLDVATTKDDEDSAPPASSPRAPSATLTSKVDRHKLEIETETQAKATISEEFLHEYQKQLATWLVILQKISTPSDAVRW